MDEKNTQIPVSSPDAPAESDAVINSDGVMQQAPDAAPANDQPVPPQSVMDVTPPPHDEAVTPNEAPAEPMPDLATEHAEAANDVTPAPAEAASSDAPETAVDTPPADAAPTTDQTNIAPAVVTPTGADKPAEASHVKKSGKGLMIAIAVVLALVLASVAVLFYMKSQDDKEAAKKTDATAQKDAAAKASAVKSTDVESASKEVDTSISSLDDKDFNSDALSDAALGLQ